MGGCKCTYRNCSMKSDGKSHMFHYPVFDRVRCHQWLTNAHRLDFLNLKVSQLKNRVVCQYHFTPESFMNFKMDKLIYDAVPTINGPYCTEADYPDNDFIQENNDTVPIIPDEIENEQLTFSQRIANASVKYSDFLLNAEVPVIEVPLEEVPVYYDPLRLLNIKKESAKKKIPTTIVVPQKQVSYTKQDNKNVKNNTTRSSNRVQILSERKITTPYPIKENLAMVPTSPSILLHPGKIGQNSNKGNIISNDKANTIGHGEEKSTSGQQYLENQSDQINQLQHGSGSQVIDANTNAIEQMKPTENEEWDHLKNVLANVSVVNKTTFQSYIEQTQPPPVNIALEAIPAPPCLYVNMQDVSNSIKLVDNETKLNKSLLRESNRIPKSQNISQQVNKNKIAPERVAEIEEKRKFNKKLRDMIEFCLDEQDILEKNDKTQDSSLSGNHVIKLEQYKTRSKAARLAAENSNQLQSKHRDLDDKVISAFSNEPRLPRREEYNFASLEARIQKMEDTLLRKIEQNTERIVDLKKTFATASCSKKTVTTQTISNSEDSKKHLFLEISKHLSASTSSIIYEELFLNKFSKRTSEEDPDTAEVPQAKRRMRR